jgi:hypothetical protein
LAAKQVVSRLSSLRSTKARKLSSTFGNAEPGYWGLKQDDDKKAIDEKLVLASFKIFSLECIPRSFSKDLVFRVFVFKSSVTVHPRQPLGFRIQVSTLTNSH